jgi:hypothetical protein
MELTAAVRRAEAEVIIHQLTALSSAGNFRKLDQKRQQERVQQERAAERAWKRELAERTQPAEMPKGR